MFIKATFDAFRGNLYFPCKQKEVHNIVKDAVTKTIPKQKKCSKAKWLLEEAY